MILVRFEAVKIAKPNVPLKCMRTGTTSWGNYFKLGMSFPSLDRSPRRSSRTRICSTVLVASLRIFFSSLALLSFLHIFPFHTLHFLVSSFAFFLLSICISYLNLVPVYLLWSQARSGCLYFIASRVHFYTCVCDLFRLYAA